MSESQIRELVIRLTLPAGADEYLIQVTESPLERAEATAPVRGLAEIGTLDSRLCRTGDQSAYWTQEELVDLHRNVFNALLPTAELQELFWRCIGAGGTRLRLVLECPASSPLSAVPWETILWDEHSDGLRKDLTIARRPNRAGVGESIVAQAAPLVLTVKGRMVSATDDYDEKPLDWQQEWDDLRQGVRQANPAWDTEFELFEPESVEALRERLAVGPDIVHLIGHGTWSGEGGGLFALSNSTEGISPKQLFGSGPASLPRLVVLNFCHSGAGSSGQTPQPGFGEALLELGVPVVVGMQARVLDCAAALFAHAFYQELARGEGVDRAVRVGRLGMREALRAFEDDYVPVWACPVLFMGVDGLQWSVEKQTQGARVPPGWKMVQRDRNTFELQCPDGVLKAGFTYSSASTSLDAAGKELAGFSADDSGHSVCCELAFAGNGRRYRFNKQRPFGGEDSVDVAIMDTRQGRCTAFAEGPTHQLNRYTVDWEEILRWLLFK